MHLYVKTWVISACPGPTTVIRAGASSPLTWLMTDNGSCIENEQDEDWQNDDSL